MWKKIVHLSSFGVESVGYLRGGAWLRGARGEKLN